MWHDPEDVVYEIAGIVLPALGCIAAALLLLWACKFLLFKVLGWA